jgi:hypothetical protein
MKNLSVEEMEKIDGGISACTWMYVSFGLVVVSTFAGPAGIGAGAVWFIRGVQSAYECGGGRGR